MRQPPNPEGAVGEKVHVPSQDKLSINVLYHATSNRIASEAAPGGFEAMDLPTRASRHSGQRIASGSLKVEGSNTKEWPVGSSIGAKLQMHGALPRQLAKSLLHLDTFHGEPLLNVLGSAEDAHRGVRRTTIFAVPPPLSPQRTRPRAAWQLLPAEGRHEEGARGGAAAHGGALGRWRNAAAAAARSGRHRRRLHLDAAAGARRRAARGDLHRAAWRNGSSCALPGPSAP
mmetsp:Transcript_60733/g.174127  ORF Transcript_60733/g.174127 Transcript_60733/m.174127 type:complete len:230 (-) Transcript_60733:60-749(-)